MLLDVTFSVSQYDFKSMMNFLWSSKTYFDRNYDDIFSKINHNSITNNITKNTNKNFNANHNISITSNIKKPHCSFNIVVDGTFSIPIYHNFFSQHTFHKGNEKYTKKQKTKHFSQILKSNRLHNFFL